MFAELEKEIEAKAEKYADKNIACYGSSSFGDITNYHDLRQSFIDGAKFVYNKMNEWHFVENGDLPKKTTSVLAYFKGEGVSLVECTYIPDEGFKHPVFSEWYKPTAWIEKEIIFPEEIE